MLRRIWPLALVLAGCSVETGPAPPPPAVTIEPTLPPVTNGTLVVHWTIDGRVDPNACVQTVTTTIEISVFDPAGNEVGAFQQQCEAFSTSITLVAGSYNGSATLLDANGVSRTTTVFIDPFNLAANETFDLTVDFPASSFR
jgi:hypothetical protein